MKKKLIIHIGFPKTATTSLQLNLFSDLYKDRKLEYLNHLNVKSPYLGNIEVKNVVKYITSNIRSSAVEKELKFLKQLPAGNYLISSENISFFYESFTWGYTSEMTLDNFHRIKELFSDIFNDIEFLIGIRAHINLIPSFYRQQYQHMVVENPKFKKFNHWLDFSLSEKSLSGELLLLNYTIVYRRIVDLFGKDKIHILVFEDLFNNPDDFYNQLATFFGVSKIFIEDSLSKEKINVGTRALGNYITSQPTINQKYIGPIRYVIKKVFSQKIFNIGAKYFGLLMPTNILNKSTGKGLVLDGITEEQLQKIYSAYKDSNLELMNLAGLEYEKFIKYKYI